MGQARCDSSLCVSLANLLLFLSLSPSASIMEAIFDNKANVLDAKLRTSHDNSVIYSISTDQTTWSKTYTYVRDMNPAGREDPIVVGIINWDKKTFEVNGHRKTLKEIRRKPGRFALK